VRAAALALVMLASATAMARPRAQVAPFVVRGDETLACFGPEVARAIAAALEGAGVETGAGGEQVITGSIERMGDEGVRLRATLRGKTLVAEGPLEAVDDVAAQLANKLAPMMLENDPAAQRAAERRAREAEKRAAAVALRPVPQSHAGADRKAETKPSPKVDTSAEPETKTEPPVVVAKSEPKPETELPAESSLPSTSAPKSEPLKVEPPKQETWSPPRVDSPPQPPPTPPPVYAPPSYAANVVRGRVVAHAIGDIPMAYPGAGQTATRALYDFLHRRLRLSVVPMGVGLTTTSLASEEAYRAGARAVVMARLEAVDYFAGPSARVRLEVLVIRDGRPVMRRVVQSAPSNVGDARRGIQYDPVFQAVTLALEALVPELFAALSDVR
jgi:hypothetical protein